MEVAIPKLRGGSYFPVWLLERRRRAERALTIAVATCCLLGVSNRRTENLVETLGITWLSKSQVSNMAKELDEHVGEFRPRPLGAGPYTFLAADALVLKVREGGRVVNVHALLATGVNADGHREILGLQVTLVPRLPTTRRTDRTRRPCPHCDEPVAITTTARRGAVARRQPHSDGAGLLGFFRGLSGVALVTSDTHTTTVDSSWSARGSAYGTRTRYGPCLASGVGIFDREVEDPVRSPAGSMHLRLPLSADAMLPAGEIRATATV